MKSDTETSTNSSDFDDSDDSDGGDDDEDFVPSITGNYDIDEAIITHPYRFQSGFYYSLSVDGE